MNADFVRKLAVTLDMIKFPHSVFALPFAMAAAFFAADGFPGPRETLLIVSAMVTARNAAMSFNRLADRGLDALNPRTRGRALPSGRLSPRFAAVFCAVNAALFVAAAASFNTATLLLSPAALAIVFGYSLAKRYTDYTQVYLGVALGIAPVAVWIAITGTVSAFALCTGAAVTLWAAGFDLIYACLDVDFDRRHGVGSLAARFGIARALILSRMFHAGSVVFFTAAGFIHGLGAWYFSGIALIAVFLVREHRLVRPSDLSRVNEAFFTMNGGVSLAYLAFSLAEIYHLNVAKSG